MQSNLRNFTINTALQDTSSYQILSNNGNNTANVTKYLVFDIMLIRILSFKLEVLDIIVTLNYL